MKKITKSFLAVSLSSAMLFQNVLVTSYADKANTTELSKNFYIKNSSSKNEISTEQVDPLSNPTYSMGNMDNIGNTSSLKNRSIPLKLTNLSNPNAIGLGTVTANSLNVRSQPSNSSSVITIINNGDNVDILKKEDNWYKISVNDTTGYVSASYIKLNPIEKGIDVSKWNGTIDWNKVKNSGIDYVIIRAGYGTSTVDPYFTSHIKGASEAGLKIGIYWFSYATSVSKAQQEVNMCLQTINPYKDKISYPVFFDYEYASVDYAKKLDISLSKNLASNMANTFLAGIENAGYISGVYTNKDFGDRYFYEDILYSNNLWIAQYNSTCTYPRPYMMWQYSDKGTINGIGTTSSPKYFDVNYTLLKPTSSNIEIDDRVDLSDASISKISNQIYTGNSIKPNLTITLDQKILKENEDYTVSYSNNISIGTAKVTIEGIGNYKGSASTTFIINPRKVDNVSLVNKTTSSLSFSWNKLDDVDGYKVYKYNEKTNNYNLIKTITNSSITNYTDENLTSSSVYKYKVKGYKSINSLYYYGDYSDVFTESTKVNNVTNLKLNSRNSNSLNISWNKIAGVDGYAIYKLDFSTNTYQKIATIYGDSTTNYTNRNLTSATNYYYKIKTFKNSNGINYYSNFSSTLKATTRPLQPSLYLSSPTSKSIKSSWSKISSRTTGYEIYMSTSKYGTYSLVGTTSNKNFTKTSLTKGKTYYFKVRAYRTVDNTKIYSLYSPIKSIKCK